MYFIREETKEKKLMKNLLAGHVSVEITARYDRRPEASKKKAAGLLLLPYYGRGVK